MAQQPVTSAPNRTRRYLRIADLRRLRHLFFSSRRVVEGHYSGRHASPQRGHSVEYSDHREYTPGDEIGDIDWKVYGRTDRMVIKLFEHQSDMTVHILIDASASMGYPGPSHYRKFDHACHMAAAIAFLTIRQQDRVSLSIAKQGLDRFMPARGSVVHLDHLLAMMEEAWPVGAARLDVALSSLVQRTSRKGLIIIFSDLLDDQTDILRQLSAFTHRGNEVIVFHILHADELNLPDISEAVFQDSETASRVRLNVEDIRDSYRKRLNQFISDWQRALRARGIDYNLVSTAQPYQAALEQYLFGRASVT